MMKRMFHDSALFHENPPLLSRGNSQFRLSWHGKNGNSDEFAAKRKGEGKKFIALKRCAS